MDAHTSALPSRKTRMGFHYFPDTLHFRDSDLAAWLPELQALGCSWLVIQSSVSRAIPESFVAGLLQAGIEPLVQFDLSLSNPPEINSLQTILEAYAHWGVRGVLFFDRPNMRSAWPSSGWAQQDLVERFLDRFQPLANMAIRLGLNPLFPALEPGGNYWDTAFLRAALQSLDRRKQSGLLQNLVLCAHAWTSGRSLNWGAGGPESWPESRPYHTPHGSQDQRGFRIYDWYQSTAVSILGHAVPILLLNAAIHSDPYDPSPVVLPAQEHKDLVMSIVRLLYSEPAYDPYQPAELLEPISQQVLACAFYQLSGVPGSAGYSSAWYQAGERLPAVQAVKDWVAQPRQAAEVKSPIDEPLQVKSAHPIQHYVLLPKYEWGVADWHLDAVKPYLKKYTPTLGFSIDEAKLAARVTVIGGPQSYPEETLDQLRLAGCLVERISGDGTSIATQLAER